MAKKTAAKAASKSVTKQKPAKPNKSQIADLLVTKTKELIAQRRRYEVADREFESSHAQSSADKKNMELQQEKLNQIVKDIDDIQNGNFTLPLPFKGSMATGGSPQPAASTTEDVGGKKPLTILTAKSLKSECPSHHRDGVGLSDAQVETLSKAIDGEKTIAGLEKLQRTNPVWTRSIKGFGEAAITKLQDAHEVVRRAFPIPSPDDKPEQPSTGAAASNGKPVEAAKAPTETIADKLGKLEPSAAKA